MAAASRAALAALAALAAFVALAAPAGAAPKVDGEFAIAGGLGTDNDIVQGPDGNMWVTTENVNGVAKITPAGVVTEYPLDNSAFGIAVGPDNRIWVSTAIGVIRFPAGNPGNATPFDVGIPSGRGIVAGPDGRMWVAAPDQLVSFEPDDPVGTADSTAIPGFGPHGMSVSSDGLIWAAGTGNVYSAPATVPTTATPHDIQINATGIAQDVAGGPNGQVAYVAPSTDPQSVGRIDPGGNPLMTELENSDPFGITFAPDGAYWIARSGANDLLRLTPEGQTTTLEGFSPAANVGPRKIATGPNNTLWVTLDDQSKVARVTGVAAPEPPNTAIDKKPKKKLKARDRRNGRKGKARARFRFSSTTAGASFECSLRKRKKEPRFKSCESPAKYKLKPGRYRFEVRAVAGGVEDPTPASYGFKVVRKKR